MAIYKFWLHVEKIRQTKDGDLEENLNDEFMPVQIGEFSTKKQMEKAYYEYDNQTSNIDLSNQQKKNNESN